MGGRKKRRPGWEQNWTCPTHRSKDPKLTLTRAVAGPRSGVCENVHGEGQPLTFPSPSESLELLLLLLLESEELPEPC